MLEFRKKGWLISSQDAPYPMGSGLMKSTKARVLEVEVILIQAPPAGVNPLQGIPRHFDAFKNVPGVNKMIRIQDLLPQIKQVIPIFLPFWEKFVGEQEAAHQITEGNVGISLTRHTIFMIDDENLSLLLQKIDTEGNCLIDETKGRKQPVKKKPGP